VASDQSFRLPIPDRRSPITVSWLVLFMRRKRGEDGGVPPMRP